MWRTCATRDDDPGFRRSVWDPETSRERIGDWGGPDQAFNEASFAARGTQEPKRCACASACVPVSGRCLLDMKYPSTLSPKPEP